MTGLRHKAGRILGALSFVALLLAPVLLSGHRHDGSDSSAPQRCALCVVTHHAPAAVAPPVPHVGVPPRHIPVYDASARTPEGDFRLCSRSRAPPASSVPHVA